MITSIGDRRTFRYRFSAVFDRTGAVQFRYCRPRRTFMAAARINPGLRRLRAGTSGLWLTPGSRNILGVRAGSGGGGAALAAVKDVVANDSISTCDIRPTASGARSPGSAGYARGCCSRGRKDARGGNVAIIERHHADGRDINYPDWLSRTSIRLCRGLFAPHRPRLL